MLKVSEIYDDVALDDIFSDQNGNLSFERYNRMSWRGTLKFIDWLTGDTKGGNPPPPLNQKNRDFLAPFIVPAVVQTGSDGTIPRPSNYYTWDNGYLITTNRQDCDQEDDEVETIQVPIEMLTTDKFNIRSGTYIESLKPSLAKPIIRLTSTGFEVLPKDLGTVQIEYVRLPVKAQIVTMKDDVFNNEVPDPNKSVNYDFPESARNHLVYFITQEFALHTREKALLETNQVIKP